MLKSLQDKVKAFKANVHQTVKQTEKEMLEIQKNLGIKESTAPRGSFEYLRDNLHAVLATEYTKIFPKAGYTPYICCVYLDSIIVETGENYFNIPYTSSAGVISLGMPRAVEKTFVLKESIKKEREIMREGVEKRDLAKELKESNVEITESAMEKDFEMSDFIPLKEAKYDADTGEIEVVLIEAGTNPKKKRHYPVSTIQEAAPLFRGLKMYLNHPTKTEEKELPERDITKWASTLVESWADNGKAMGRVAVHDKWLRERLADPVAREHIGLSINTGGRISKGKIDGQEMEIVEKIVLQRSNGPASVDWVTEAGARGRVSRLLKESTQQEEEEMDLKTLDLATLKKERPDLIEAANRDVKESGTADQKDKELKEANAKIVEMEKANKMRDQKEKVNALLKESKIPEAAKERVAKDVNVILFDSETKLKEAVEAGIKTELEYINKFSAKGKIQVGGEGKNEKSLLESMSAELDARAGVSKKEKEEDKD